jgi:hypothetical protein
VSDVPQNVLLWSIFLAFSLYVDDVRKERARDKAAQRESPPELEVLAAPTR